MCGRIEKGPEDTAIENIYTLSRERRNQVKTSSLKSLGVAYTQHCGDELELFVREKGNVIQQCEYRGDGCMIMHASAHILCEILRSISVDECCDLSQKVLYSFRKNLPVPLSELEIFSVIQHSHIRRSCAELPWQLLLNALIKKKDE